MSTLLEQPIIDWREDLEEISHLDPSEPCRECAPEVIREADWTIRCKGCGHLVFWCEEHFQQLRDHVASSQDLAKLFGMEFAINCRECGIKGPTIDSVMEYWRRR